MTKTYYVFVDSRAIYTTSHISPSQYVINFTNVFTNVVSIELVYALYGKSGQNTETYVNLNIEEFAPYIVSNHSASAEAFTQLPFWITNTENLCQYDKQMYPSILTFDNPMKELSKLSITYLDKNKKIYPVTEHILRFEIKCLPASMTEKSTMANPPIKKDPYTLLGLSQGTYNLVSLANAFKEKATVMRKDGMSKDAYNELKDAFTYLAKNLTR